MGRLIIVIAGLWGSSASAEKLTYYSPKPEFEIERTDKAVSLKSQMLNLKVEIEPCNQALVDGYWKEAVSEFQRYPKTKRRPAADAFAELGNELRIIWPDLRPDNLQHLDHEFLSLIAREKRKCPRS